MKVAFFSTLYLSLTLSACITVAVRPDLGERKPGKSMEILPPVANQKNWCVAKQTAEDHSFVTFLPCLEPSGETLIRVSNFCQVLGARTLMEHHVGTLATVTADQSTSRLISEAESPFVMTDFQSSYGDVVVKGTLASLKRGDCVQDIVLVTRNDPADFKDVFANYIQLLSAERSPDGSMEPKRHKKVVLNE